MAAAIDRMVADLEAALVAHEDAARRAVREAAQRMSDRVSALSSPLYGVRVDSRVVDVNGGHRVDVRVSGTDGPGRVFGGQSAVRAQVDKTVELTAKETGLDRRR